VASNPFDDPLSDATRAGSTGPDPTLAPGDGFVTRPASPPNPPTSPWARPDTPAYMPPPPYPAAGHVPPTYPQPAQPVYQAAGPHQPGWPAYPPSYPLSFPSGYPTKPIYPTPTPVPSRSPRGALFFMIAGLVALVAVATGVSAGLSHHPNSSPPASLSDPGNDPFGGLDPFGTSAPFPLGGGGADGAQVAPGDPADRLGLGQSVHVTNGDSAWIVTVTAATWSTGCPTVKMMSGRELEATVVVKVTHGSITVSPLDFSYTDPDGAPGLPLPFVGCGAPAQGSTLSAGSEHTYTVDFDVLGRGGGVIGYGGMLSSIATWAAPS
jgi:hypothetical protein